MNQEQLLASLKKDVRSLLISAKSGLPPERLRKDYANMLGHPLPLRALGFHSVLDMVREMPDVVTLQYLVDGSLVLKAVSDESTRGIEELVARQRKQKTNNKSSSRSGFFSLRYSHQRASMAPPPRRGLTPPALPAQLRTQLRQLLAQGPIGLSELEASFARRFGYPLRVAKYGFYSIAEVLEVATDMVAVHQSRTGSLLSLRGAPEVTSVVRTGPVKPVRTGPVKPPSPKLTLPADAVAAPEETPKYPRTQNELASLAKDVFPSSDVSAGGQEQGVQMEPTHPESQSIQQTQLFHKSVIKLEEELRQRILENGHAGAVSPELKAKLRQVVGQNSEGVSIHELPAEYKRVFGEELPVIQTGFLSVTEMVGALSDTLYLWPVAGDEGHHWMVTDIKHAGRTQPAAKDLGEAASEEGLGVSETGYYFSCADSPWDDRGAEHADDEDSGSGVEEELHVTNKTYHQTAYGYPTVRVRSGAGAAVPPDALRGQRLRPPTRRSPRQLVAVLVERVESPDHFYVRFDESEETRALENMMIEMRSCYFCPEVSERYRLPEHYVRQGQVCCVGSRNMWFYRVVIHRLLGDTEVEVYYVDFGDLASVARDNLKFLKSCYSELPAQAVPSSLAGIKPIGASWSVGATDCFQELCCERTLVAALHGYHQDFLQLFLCDTHTEEDMYIHSVLEAQGHGLACPPDASSALCGQFNPVTLYLGDSTLDDAVDMDLDEEPSPESRIRTLATLELCNRPQESSSPSQTLTPVPDLPEEELADLPELEFIEVPEDNSQAQVQNAEEVLSCTTWDQGWTPDPPLGKVVQPEVEPGYHGDAAERINPPAFDPGAGGDGGKQPRRGAAGLGTPPVGEPGEEEKQPWRGAGGIGVPPVGEPGEEEKRPWRGAGGIGVPPAPPMAVPPLHPTLRTLSLHTPGLMQTQASCYGLLPPPNFIFPLSGAGAVFSADQLRVRPTSPFVLGPAARLAAGGRPFSWYPHA